ncbi:MAG TPA: Gfo/Idh/MocA family oxidoreductase [Kiritimatiellia bacterium]|nr:Gfo/Idh/MocA family oxidoreductase [Kiritimatiellia bacterium]HOR97389.1 Gfo/Idh/MocA family oxidoreductase [Kiritimatiellia bacterium]HPK37194.1 Gfo/Idh/MocA family oxidoreductase [Kiritimatiellia bacterium]
MMSRTKTALPHRKAATRRGFLKRTLAASTLTAFPAIRATGRPVTGDKVRLACCGIGNQGASDINNLYATGLCDIVALCDTDMGAPHTRKILDTFPDAPRFQDFRKMLDKLGGQIDALCIGVPDHTHFPIAMMAMGLGKHVYVEKPMAHTFREIELMMKAEKKNRVAAQMGNQGHSGANYFQFKAWTEAGIIRNVTRIVAHMNGARRWHKWNGVVTSLRPAQPVPETLDWDTWLGQVPFHGYHRDYVHGDWRCWYSFGNGALGDWGAHILDTAHQFLELGMPTEVSALNLEGHNPYVFPMASTLSFKFAARGAMPPVEVLWYDGVKNFPELPPGFGGSAKTADDIPTPGGGSTAVSKLSPGKEIYAEDLTFKGGSHSSTLEIIPAEKARDMANRLPEYPKNQSNHYKNFLLACMGRETCRSSFEVAGPLSQVLALGCIAQRLNTTFTLDPVTRRITGNKLANDLLDGPPPRKGWEQYYRV